MLALPSPGRANDAPASAPWFRKSLVGMEVGPTGTQFGSDPTDVGYAAKFNGKDVVKACVGGRLRICGHLGPRWRVRLLRLEDRPQVSGTGIS